MESTEIISKDIEDSEEFWNALQIWINKPHVVNRRLIGSKLISSYRITSIDQKNVFSNQDLPNLFDTVNSIVNIEDIEHILSGQGLCLQPVHLHDLFSHLNNKCEQHSVDTESCILYLLINKLIPRNESIQKPCFQVTILDKKSHSAVFFCCSENIEITNPVCPLFPYKIHLDDCILRMYIYPPGLPTESSPKWLSNNLFPKLCSWMNNTSNSNQTNKLQSLGLLEVEEYSELYQQLKLKYGQNMVKIWPENTDPAKFVYEDIAIATYLILIWKKERLRLNSEKKQSFVDLGCGNGLLVHILSLEGHPGFGIDLRKRKIWNEYPVTTKLEVKEITPSDSCLFPDVDWLIGNHSDELTPWIPVMAARSSTTCRYFVLPCCAYEFNGSKYQRKNSSNSLYSEYLLYIKQISELCGFQTIMDKMRIPSTKRICLVGMNRNNNIGDFEEYCLKIQSFINDECKRPGAAEPVELGTSWSEDFKPRNSVEAVKNCTQLDKSLIDDIRGIVVQQLLSKKRYLTDPLMNQSWNAGGVLSLAEIVNIIPKEKLQRLKSECGGLQTLLKNQNIFLVVNGNVQLKYPKTVKEVLTSVKKNVKKNEIIIQQKKCWFYENHPNGCPLKDTDCSFKHC